MEGKREKDKGMKKGGEKGEKDRKEMRKGEERR